MKFLLAFVLLLSVSSILGEKKSYSGYKVLRTEPLDNDVVVQQLRDLQNLHPEYDFWKEANKGLSAEIMTSEENRPTLERILKAIGVKFSLKIEDVEKFTELTSRMKGRKTRSLRDNNLRYDWDDYKRLDEIYAYLDELAALQPDWVKVVSIGQSYEGRDMRVIQITKAGPGKPNMWFEAGIHAREWISPAVATWVLKEMVENYEQNSDYVDNLNLHMIVVANPDGYEYTHTNDRLWRKTRSDNPGSNCKGTDPNRNWDYKWGTTGVSPFACADTYPGAEVFSEIETRNIRDYTLTLDPVPIYANAIHSAAELWLYPYGANYNEYPENVDEIIEMGDAAVAALYDVHGVRFVCEHSAALYPASGDADDWYKGVLGARFAYTIELRDQGYGFELPPVQIVPSGEEMWGAYQEIFGRLIALSKSE